MPDVERLSVAGKTVLIVEDHHHSLLPWAECHLQLGTAPHVLTLDHHTDTLPAFSHYDETHPRPHEKHFDWKNDPRAAIDSVLPDLRHDEHFDLAVRNGIISSATIFSHVNFSRNVHPAITIVHDPSPDESPDTLRQYYARALESDILESNLRRAPLPPDRPFLLDIDLDYFKTEASVHPKDPRVFSGLVRRAYAVSICRERDWVRLLNLDFGRHTFEWFLDGVLDLIRRSADGQCA